ncbi:MAG: hypothetical protein WCY37_04290 [Candidatus Dojkabacteria bacterium]
MLKIDAREIICTLRDRLCPPGGQDADGYYDGIIFNLRVDSIRTSHLFIAICGNSNVFVAHTYKWRWQDIPISGWRNTSNHDSCWRTDGLRLISEVYFDAARVMNPNVAPRDLDIDCSFAIHSPWDLVKIKHQSCDPEFHYRRELVDIKGRS